MNKVDAEREYFADVKNDDRRKKENGSAQSREKEERKLKSERRNAVRSRGVWWGGVRRQR